MYIRYNAMAANAYRWYNINYNRMAKAAERLSSGYRINRAGDDPAGLAISEKMRAQIRGLNMASKNVSDAISLVQTAEGALQEIQSMLQRMNELAVQAATDTNAEIDRNALQLEFENLQEEIDQLARTTKFNDRVLLDGSLAAKDKGGQSAGGMAGGSAAVKAFTDAVEIADAFGIAAPVFSTAGNALAAGEFVNTSGGGRVKFLAGSKNAFETGKILDVYACKGDNPDIAVVPGASDSLEDVVINVGDKKLRFVSSTDDRIQAGARLDYSTGAAAGLTFADSDGNSVIIKIDPADANIGTAIKNAVGTMGVKGKAAFYDRDVNTVDTMGSAFNAVKAVTGTGELKIRLSPGNGRALASGGYTVSVVEKLGVSEFRAATEDSVNSAVYLRLTDKNGSVILFQYDGNRSDGANAENPGKKLGEVFGGAGDVIAFTDENGNTISVKAGAAQTDAASLFALNGKSFDVEAANLESGQPLEAGRFLTFGKVTNVDIDDSALAQGRYTFKLGVLGGGFQEYNAQQNDFGVPAPRFDALQIRVVNEWGETVNVLKLSNIGEIVDSSNTLLNGAGDMSAATVKKNQTLVFKSDDGAHTIDIKVGGQDLSSPELFKMLGQINETTYDVGGRVQSGGSPEQEGAAEVTAGIYIQVGAEEGQTLGISIEAMDTAALGVNKSLVNIKTREDASKAISATKNAINKASYQRAYLGAIQNRLEHKIAALDITAENLASAESRIRDVDMAAEMMEYVKANILMQVSTAMLAQANAMPNLVLSLLMK